MYSDVRLSAVTYRDARNLKPKLVENSNDNNNSLGSPIESRNISTCSKFKTEARRKLKDNNFVHGCPIESPNILRGSKLKMKTRRQFKRH